MEIPLQYDSVMSFDDVTIIPRSIWRFNYELLRVGRVRRPQCVGRNAADYVLTLSL